MNADTHTGWYLYLNAINDNSIVIAVVIVIDEKRPDDDTGNSNDFIFLPFFIWLILLFIFSTKSMIDLDKISAYDDASAIVL